jgi:hypothetical protein
MKLRLFVILFLGGIVVSQFHCTPRSAKSKTAVQYNEDLSGFRPESTTPDEKNAAETNDTETLPVAYTPPEHDITRQLDIVLNERMENNENKTITVYTVQVYTGRSREEANAVRMKIFEIMPDADPQLVYKKLRFKVQVGRFYDRVSAYKTFHALKDYFPGAMLVPEAVDVEDLIKENE